MTSILHPQLVAALISVAVGIATAVITLLVARRQWQQRDIELQQRTRELELRSIEAQTKQRELEAKIEEQKQSQHTEVLKSRLASYPKIWGILIVNGLPNGVDRQNRTHDWAKSYLGQLNDCDAAYGVLFSEPVYEAFYHYRQLLAAIVDDLSRGERVPLDRHEELNRALLGDPANSQPGLAGLMKNDLGSYTYAALAKHKDA